MNKNSDGFKTWYALSLAMQLGFLIVIPIAGFIVLGIWLDVKLNTSPLLLFIGLGVGLIVTAYEVYYYVAPLIERNKHKND